jgi:F420 biosynthesis protein FbiB-like protein
MGGMDGMEMLLTRRSVKKLKPIIIDKDVIERILHAAIMAPSAHNAQPWRFIVVDDPQIKMELAEGMASILVRDLIRDGYGRAEAEQKARESISRINSASLLIVACVTMEGMNVYPDRRRRKAEYIMAIQSVSAAIQNLLLAAHYEGLGACWRCAPLFAQSVVRRILRIPRGFDPIALIEIGQPASKFEAPPRKPLNEVAYHNVWGKPL